MRQWLVLAILGVAACGGSPARAQQEAAPGAGAQAADQPPAWASRCVAEARDASPDCSVFQRLMTQAGQLLGSVTIRVPPGNGDAVLTISAPLGLYVSSGIGYSIDGAALQTLAIQTCDQSGCLATQPATDDLLDAMFRGKKLDIAFANLNRQTITLSLSLVGFTAAYQRTR